MAVKRLPLGVDIGATRIRMASSVLCNGTAHIEAVAARDISSGAASSGAVADCTYVATMIEEMRDELQVKERRCVCSVGVPDATVKTLQLPPMTWLERRRAAAFEALASVPYPREEAAVRIHPIDAKKNLHAVGVVRRTVVASRLRALRTAGLVPVAVDYEAFAYGRILREYDAVVDVGLEHTAAHLMRRERPLSICRNTGGAHITQAIERELSIDPLSAEKRKRIVGTAGGGEAARAALVADVTHLLESLIVADGFVRRIAVCGNGARLARLCDDVARASGLDVELAAAAENVSGSYPPDVLEAAMPDWAHAIGLSLWAQP